MDISATHPSFRLTYKHLLAFEGAHAAALSREQSNSVGEIKRRIRRLENDYNRLMKTNDALLHAECPKVDFDAESGTFAVRYKGGVQSFSITRANPNVPVQIVGMSAGGVYNAGSERREGDAPSLDELRFQLEKGLEDYYHNAFRIAKLVSFVTGRKYDCREVTIVRNKLIEHPEPGSIYSFGFGANGPLVKPMGRAPMEWRDLGLYHNTKAFLDSLTGHFAT